MNKLNNKKGKNWRFWITMTWIASQKLNQKQETSSKMEKLVASQKTPTIKKTIAFTKSRLKRSMFLVSMTTIQAKMRIQIKTMQRFHMRHTLPLAFGHAENCMILVSIPII